MKPTIRFVLFATLLALVSPLTATAAVDWEATPAIQTKAAPLDTAITLDGKWTFVLTVGGSVQVYDAEGVLNDSIPVDPTTDRISLNGTGDKLVLSSQRNKTVQQLTITFVANINTKGAPFQGPANAPVAVVVFSDFQCPYCAKVGTLLNFILERNPGKVKVAYKHFPLPFHKFARAAAVAAVAAQRQGKFWKFHDILFKHGHELDNNKILELAKEAGLDLERFKADIAAPNLDARVAQDIADGAEAGVRGTPTIFVNGRTLKERSPEGLQALIEQELARTKGK